MNLVQIHQTLASEPLILTPQSHASLVRIFTEHRNRDKAAREGVDMCGEKVELPQAELDHDGIMHIPVNGPIGRGLGAFEKGAGAIDVQDILDDLEEAEGNPDCRAIIFHFDSPGGMYSGTPELADEIMECSKPTAAYIPGMACSGGYWLASACNFVCATKSADLGNVGVYCYLLDQTEQFKAEGLKPMLITSGEYKGMGAPGIPLDQVQIQHLQDRVDEMANQFCSHVMERRPLVNMDDLRGQCFKAQSALAKGFIDMIVPDLDAVVALF